MIYRSNFTAPDLAPRFKKTISRTMPHSRGHDVLSEQFEDERLKIYENCGFWTHDEAAILYTCAQIWRGWWIDIGAHTGWTASHIDATGNMVVAVEPMLQVGEFRQRFDENTEESSGIARYLMRSDEFFETHMPQQEKLFAGAVIDGDHDHPWPLNDAMMIEARASASACILIHDFSGEPTYAAARFLRAAGWKLKIYYTPHMIACAYRGEYLPVDHVRDNAVDWLPVRRALIDAGFVTEAS